MFPSPSVVGQPLPLAQEESVASGLLPYSPRLREPVAKYGLQSHHPQRHSVRLAARGARFALWLLTFLKPLPKSVDRW